MTKRLARDIAERAGWTFVQAFAASLLGNAMFSLDLTALRIAALAGLAGVLAVLKGVAASRVGEQTAALPG